jgi:hypothetical protein
MDENFVANRKNPGMQDNSGDARRPPGEPSVNNEK